jgi:hypothetical protein
MSNHEVFDPIKIKWKGADVLIPADRVMGALYRVEQTITINELGVAINTGNVPLAKVARAFAEILRYADVAVKDDEVYAAMFQEASGLEALTAIRTLMVLMVPPARLLEKLSNSPGAKSGGKVSTALLKRRIKTQ